MLDISNCFFHTYQIQYVSVRLKRRYDCSELCSHGTAQPCPQMFMVLDGTGSICITAIASNIMQSVASIVVTLVSHMLSSLCMKSDFTHVISEPSSLNMLQGVCAFSTDNTFSDGTFLKELTANKRKYITSPFMTTLLVFTFTVFCMSAIVFTLGFGSGS